MRQNRKREVVKKVKEHHLKYVFIDKKTKTATIYHYKKELAEKVKLSTRTLDRKIPFETEDWAIYRVNTLKM